MWDRQRVAESTAAQRSLKTLINVDNSRGIEDDDVLNAHTQENLPGHFLRCVVEHKHSCIIDTCAEQSVSKQASHISHGSEITSSQVSTSSLTLKPHFVVSNTSSPLSSSDVHSHLLVFCLPCWKGGVEYLGMPIEHWENLVSIRFNSHSLRSHWQIVSLYCPWYLGALA